MMLNTLSWKLPDENAIRVHRGHYRKPLRDAG